MAAEVKAPVRRAPLSAASPAELQALGEYALRYVRPGQVIGLGTGHAASAFIGALAKSAPMVRCVATSKASEQMARKGGLSVLSLAEVARVDVTLDGADEVDPALNLIKGYGGALVREKIVAAASRRRVMLVGGEKLVARLGEHGKLPVEVIPFAAALCIRSLKRLGLRPVVRQNARGKDFITDNGNLILDCGLRPLTDPAGLEQALRAIPGVVGTGLFIAMADLVLVAHAGGKIETLRRPRPGRKPARGRA